MKQVTVKEYDTEEIRKQAAEIESAGSKQNKPENWPDPEPLPAELLPVPALPSAMLPSPLKTWLEDIADRVQCPPEFLAAAAITALASVIGNQTAIRPRRRDDWAVIPNLWGAIVGRPGILKTPALTEILKPLNRLAAEAREAYEQEAAKWKFDSLVQEAQRKNLKEEIGKALKNGRELGSLRAQLEECEIEEPIEFRYIINDSTVEKIGELLNQNPRGLLLFRDELTGLLRTLDREGHEGDRAFYLEAWNGNGKFTYDRIQRGTIHIKSVTLSILGSIQPGPLSQYLKSALSGGIGDDGLLQRFQLIVFPDIPKEFRNVDRWPDTEAKNKVFNLFKKLDSLDPFSIGAEESEDDGPPYLRFTDEAQELFDGWRGELEQDLRGGAEEHPALEGHLSKYRSLMPSLALIFHLLDVVSGKASGAVSITAAKMAVGWCTFLFEHARRIYGMALQADVQKAKAILKHIQKGDLHDPFSARDAYRPQWAGLTTAKEVADPLAMLEEYGWIRLTVIPPGELGGRPTTKYLINPKAKGGAQ